jgi:ubiquinone/menaquinone biosynthesis C-methylase UbiE
MTVREPVFDKVAPQYDELWSDAPVGQAQRRQVWQCIDSLFAPGSLVLDLGCGTGIDALHLQSRGVNVHGIDASSRMIEITRERGIDADCCRIEDLAGQNLRVDGVISNFGALNCVSSLAAVAESLATVVRPGGRLALCLLNRVCLWEIAYYLLRAQPLKALRRLKGYATSSIGATVFYPSARAVIRAFESRFRHIRSYAIGLFVPPSYVTGFGKAGVERLSALDERMGDKPVLRSLSDHRIYVFERI